ncbi:MAG: hypothetical protein IPK10_01860 [Bacteroidetes bacterium]|nr:hypothetical protein [Bacteroidota bacterium]
MFLYRFIFNSNSSFTYDGFSLDDFSVRQTPAINLGSNLVTPSGPLLTVSGIPLPDLNLHVKNLGTSSSGTFDIGYAIDGITVYSTTVTNNISPGGISTFILPGIVCPAIASSLCAFVSKVGDTDLSNDTICMDLYVLKSQNIDYSQSFDTGSVDWIPINNVSNQLTNWELGTPAYGSTTGAFSAPNAWDVNLNSGYGNSANTSLYTASFPIANTAQKHYLSFMLNYKTEAGWDGLRLEYSKDNAVTWQVLGVVNDPQGFNWYTDNSLNSSGLPAWEGNSNGWTNCSYYLNPTQLGSSMIFRFVFTSDAVVNSDGVSVDDFYFGNLYAKDAALIGFVNSSDTAMVGNVLPTQVRIENRGSQNFISLNLTYDVNGIVNSTLINGTFSPFFPLNRNIPGVVAQEGVNKLKVYVNDSSDMNVFNDTIVRNFYGFTRASIPYIESFEGPTTNGWFATSSLNEVNWERGVPSYGTTNSANSGSNVWDIALDTTYKKFQKDTLYSPVFRTIGLNNLQLSFWINYNTLFEHAGVHLQYKTNVTGWQNVDTLLQLYPYGGVMLSGRAAWTGYSFGWQEVKLNLTNYMLNAYDLRFRFIFESDSFTSLDGFSLDDFSLTGSTSLNAISSESEFQIYPNPTNDFLYVNSLFEAKQTAEFKIYTVEGKKFLGIVYLLKTKHQLMLVT